MLDVLQQKQELPGSHQENKSHWYTTRSSDDSKYVIEEDTSYSILRELESSHKNSNFTHGSVLSNSNELISKEQRPHVMHDTLPTTSPDVPQASRRG